jgi:hypothetical protein
MSVVITEEMEVGDVDARQIKDLSAVTAYQSSVSWDQHPLKSLAPKQTILNAAGYHHQFYIVFILT